VPSESVSLHECQVGIKFCSTLCHPPLPPAQRLDFSCLWAGHPSFVVNVAFDLAALELFYAMMRDIADSKEEVDSQMKSALG
jgi:hypothetical protein